jgi:serine-type D-Ala-D-Ala carboxypeptidase/endopeptidase (penicillin-binding protein 4)
MKKFYNSAFLKWIYISIAIFIAGHAKADNVTELQQRLDAIVSSANCQISVQVISASNNDIIYSYNPDAKLIPASVTKLVTAAIALKNLGVDYKFKTILYTDDKNIKDGVINGNLYLKGYGDPDLNSSDIIYLAKKLKEMNITSITGNIIYDQSYLDTDYYSRSQSNDTDLRYWPYVCALNLDKNFGGYDPAYTAADLLASDITSMGIGFTGNVEAGTTPTGDVIEVTEVSHSIMDVLAYMNKTSNNHSAITVFKVVGASKYGPPGTLEKGTRAAEEFLTSIGCGIDDFQILEGSGLTRYNYMTAGMVMKMLKSMYEDVNAFDYFYNSLAIAGIDGTIKSRMIGTEAEKNIHAKTGTLNSVTALAGYAVTRDLELLMFYISMNGFGGGASHYRGLQDDICEVLCQFSRN